MSAQVIQITGGLTPAQETCTLINRTGAALAVGDAVALNLSFVDTYVGIDPSVNADGATGYVFGAACAVTTENRNRIMAWAQEVIPDNGTGRFLVKGIGSVEMNDANPGEFLTGTDGQTYLTPLTLTEILALTTQVGIVGICIEDTGATITTKKAYVDGYAFKSLCGGDT
jgi:hypothetical protein